MAARTPQRDFKRARSAAQKEERRGDILRAARAQLTEVGVDAFSMAPLTRTSGVARATMYLYFSTREELLLALHLEETRQWVEEVERVTGPSMAVEDFLRAIYVSATRRPFFLQLAARVPGVIEKNVSIESLAESKRQGLVLIQAAGRRTAVALGRPLEEGAPLALALFTLLLGVSQAFGGPQVEVAELPADVQPLFESEDPLDAFVRMGRWLVDGSPTN